MPLRWKSGGNGAIFAIGAVLVTAMGSVLAIDMPIYFNTQNQLQTTVDAAALAAAAKLPLGEDEATEAAYEYVDQNPVAGHLLDHGDVSLDFNGNRVALGASTPVDTLVGKMICGLRGDFQADQGNNGDDPQSGCSMMTVYAAAKAQPAARDTVLVVDTSSSMEILGNMRPLNDVKSAARAFVDKVDALNNESVDRIALVQFDRTAVTRRALTSNYLDVKSAITAMPIYTGSGWNTNYYAGLKFALDELQINARPNAEKTVIFMTDGYPNMPQQGSASAYAINTCINYYNSRKYAQAKSCATTYTNYFVNVTSQQITRADQMGVTVHTIKIGGDYSSSLNTMRQLLQNPNWDPMLIETMATTTDGDQYEAMNYDANGILEIYNQVAQDIHIKLTN